MSSSQFEDHDEGLDPGTPRGGAASMWESEDSSSTVRSPGDYEHQPAISVQKTEAPITRVDTWNAPSLTSMITSPSAHPPRPSQNLTPVIISRQPGRHDCWEIRQPNWNDSNQHWPGPCRRRSSACPQQWGRRVWIHRQLAYRRGKQYYYYDSDL